MYEKVVAYERWLLTGTIKEISPKLYNVKSLLSLVKIKQIGKAVAIKTNSFWVLQHVFCFVNALMNLIAFEFGNVKVKVKSAYEPSGPSGRRLPSVSVA